ncbi:MAG: site-specific DNA-methyltransferase [Sedimentisphaerales bacterium]|nr:site-specific DNA-methyltransferase [Sedimentisphaerales bacterium]
MSRFRNKIVCGDCIEVLGKVRKPFADLIFADPPFNIGYKYDKYYDKVKKKNYIAWTKAWMSVCKAVLKPHGSFYIAIGDDYAANLKIIADELGLFMRNWIIWHYTFGQQTKTKFARAHTHIFYFVKDEDNFTFNDHAVRVPSDRQLTYNDRRANPRGKMPDDVWGEFSRVCGTFKERQGWHPCQMPESLLGRIIAVSSNAGDCVLDPFSGSGTTAAAALRLGRNYAGVEISQEYVDKTYKRLETLRKKSRQAAQTMFLSPAEISELKRLLSDMGMPLSEIAKSKDLTEIFAGQLAVRMNSDKHYSADEVISALGVLTD